MAKKDAQGITTYVDRGDDVFKSSDYRSSPFELESVPIQHPAVAEAAVAPSPDPLRLSAPKAFVMTAEEYEPSATLAESILRHCGEHLAPFKRIHRLKLLGSPRPSPARSAAWNCVAARRRGTGPRRRGASRGSSTKKTTSRH